MNRREFLAAAGATAIARPDGVLAATGTKATADSCIFIWLAGGMCHVDTFDPKEVRGDGASRAGSYYGSIATAAPEIRVCEHLPKMAAHMDRVALVRGMNHRFGNHTSGVAFSHTGRPPSGTVVYPSIGSMVSNVLGPREAKTPSYVVVGQPMEPRGPGFLGGKYGYIYVLNTEVGPAGLQPPYGRTLEDHRRREAMLSEFSKDFFAENATDARVEAYEGVSRQAFGMMSDHFLDLFRVKDEPAAVKARYGEEFGQRCLLARKLVEGGVRFVECSFNLFFINGYGWDAHGFAQQRLHLMIQSLDQGLSALLEDLEQRKLLDRTLVVLATEFGRPPDFDGQGGRGHQPGGYTVLLAGGGIRGGRVIGRTDEVGREIVERPTSVPDFFATIFQSLGIKPELPLIAPGGRPVPVTDFGKPALDLLG